MTVQHVHRDVIIAWANGQKVEYYAEGSGRWLLIEAPTFDPGTKYRVYDRFRQIKSAHAEGLVILKQDADRNWVCDRNPTWEETGVYRVAPEVFQNAVKFLIHGRPITLSMKIKPTTAIINNRYFPDKLCWFYKITWDPDIEFVRVQAHDTKHCAVLKQAHEEGLLLWHVVDETENGQKVWQLVTTPDWERADTYQIAPQSLQLAFDLLKNMPIVVTSTTTGDAAWFSKWDVPKFLAWGWTGDEFETVPDRMAIINEAYKEGKLIQRRAVGTHYWKHDVPPFYTHANVEYRIAPDELQQAYQLIKEGKHNVIVTDDIGSPPYKFMRGTDIVGAFLGTKWMGDQYQVSTYTPHADLIAAHSNGFAIDTYCSISKTWKFCAKPLWLDKVEYRQSRKVVTDIIGRLRLNRYVHVKLGSDAYLLRGVGGIEVLNGKCVDDNVVIEYTLGHKHAEAMLAYAEDAMKTETPWKLWEYNHKHNTSWLPITSHPQWEPDREYRRKIAD